VLVFGMMPAHGPATLNDSDILLGIRGEARRVRRGILNSMPSRPRSSHRELPAPDASAPYVACLWEHRIGDGDLAYDQPVLPDGRIDLVVFDEKVVLAGPAIRSTNLRFAPGSFLVGVRFRPGAAPPLVGVSAAELRDLEIPIGVEGGAPRGQRSARPTCGSWAGRLPGRAR
jgi:hypothetical protein